MKKADKITVVLSTGKEVVFEFGKRHLHCMTYAGTLTPAEWLELMAIQLRFS